MKSRIITALAVTVASGVGLASGGTATAQTTGREVFKGVIVASGVSGSREIVSSVVVAKGAFRGIGRIVEVDNRPTDPDNVSRDDLVFRRGTMHIVVMNEAFEFSLNPRTCVFRVALQQTGTVEGGTGAFTRATGSFTGAVHAHGVVPRNPDHSCSDGAAPLVEVDIVSATGTLTF